MSELSVKEVDLLERIAKKPELRTLFFRKVKGIKWFNALKERGYFDAENFPQPTPAKEEGYVNIPSWDVLNYLVKTVPELVGEKADDLAPKFLEIIRNATDYAKAKGICNYHVWQQFAAVLTQIPSKFISNDDLSAVEYWFEDKFGRSLVTRAIGKTWLAQLLEEGDSNALSLAHSLLKVLFSVEFFDQETSGRTKLEARLRLESHHIDNDELERITFLAGELLGLKAVLVFHTSLEKVLSELKNDTWSCIWQPAIEEHEQNKHKEAPGNIILAGYRDSLNGYIKTCRDEALEYVGTLLESPYQTVERLAIHCIGNNFQFCDGFVSKLIDKKYLETNYRHEMWHFLNQNYADFTPQQKQNLLDFVGQKQITDDTDQVNEISTAYEKSIWLSAIKGFESKELKLYEEAVAVAGTEPAHPDFSSYWSIGPAERKSPYSIEELSSLSIADLAATISTYEGDGGWNEPGIGGLSDSVKQLIKNAPLKYNDHLTSFADLELAYVYVIIEAYSELWNEKAKLPWDDVWGNLLSYMGLILKRSEFWSVANAERRADFVANRHWVVSSIARFLEAGAKSDDHAFPENCHEDVESILRLMLRNQSGERFEIESDAVSIAINSPRGQCILAMINMALRTCRLADAMNEGAHAEAWGRFQSFFDAELDRSENKGEYEFATIVTNYLSNFFYMSEVWVLENLHRMFDQEDYQNWLCAIQGYSYTSSVYPQIYKYLEFHGDFERVLDDENVEDRVKDNVVENIVIAFLYDYDGRIEDDYLLNVLLNRKNFDELKHLVWFVWTLRKNEGNLKKGKVFELWAMLLDMMNFDSEEGKRIASNLCLWVTFVERIDEITREFLLKVAPYADDSHNSYELLKNLARISEEQPSDANEIWLKILEGSARCYPEEAVKTIIENLVSQGEEGKRAAVITANEYLKQGVESPLEWLNEIIELSGTAEA